jgi:hypothetical protein
MMPLCFQNQTTLETYALYIIDYIESIISTYASSYTTSVLLTHSPT